MTEIQAQQRELGPELPLVQAFVPLVVLIGLLVAALVMFGDGTIGGPAQVALLLAGCTAGLVGVRNGVAWRDLEKAVGHTVGRAAAPIFILLAIGALIGVWMKAGIIPTLIVYGGQILSPQIFYLAALLISALVALVIGSSWTTAGTVGVALIGVATASGMSLPMTAGAIISGVYFGDKLSPLSDTTNLAAALAGTELFTHVRYMLWTTVPSLIIAALFFGGASVMFGDSADSDGLAALTNTLAEHFNLTALLLIPFLAIFAMAHLGVPALATIVLSVLLAMVFGMLTQPGQLQGGELFEVLKSYWSSAANGYSSDTGMELADSLLGRGGMESMLTTIWLILTAMFFSGMMERSGCLARLLSAVLGLFKRDRSILFGVGSTAMATNAVASDQFVALVIASRMYADEVERRGLKPETLSRTVEDFGTVTSPLVPWNTCGAYMAATLGVATWAYVPFCIFNLVNPFISSYYIATGRTLRWQSDEEKLAAAAEPG